MKLQQLFENKTIKLKMSKGVYGEFWDLDVETHEDSYSKERNSFVASMETAKKKGASYELMMNQDGMKHLKKSIENAIDINDDQNKKSLLNSLKKFKEKL